MLSAQQNRVVPLILITWSRSFAADCSQQQTAVYDNPEFVVGTMVWTLFDCEYYSMHRSCPSFESHGPITCTRISRPSDLLGCATDLGEPSGGWPHVISSYGQFDLAGFVRAASPPSLFHVAHNR